MSGIPVDSWPAYTKEVLRVLKPGGIAVFVELNPFQKSDDHSLPDSMPLRQV